MTAQLDTVLVSLTWMLGAGLLAARVARQYGIPDLVLFVIMGVLFGPQVLGLVHLPAQGAVGQLIVTGGAVFMLYEGGREIDISVLRRIWLGTSLLATLGVFITGGLVAVSAHYFVGVPWPIAMLAGAAISPTDPATIVPLFAQVRVRARVQQLVVSESAFNDATGAILTMVILTALQGGALSGGAIGASFLRLIVAGMLSGVAVGVIVQVLVSEGRRYRRFWTQRDENGVASLLSMLAAYTVASALGGSGFMAVFVAGIVRGNGERWGIGGHPDHKSTHDTFLSFLGTTLRILIFGVLGANVDLPLLGSLGIYGVLVMVVLLFVARPLTALVCLRLDRVANWSMQEIVFVSWVRETGVVPAALASLLLAAHAPGADVVAALVFLAVIVTILFQGPTTRAWAKRTGVNS